jgi:phage terminase Nu1 subunit (DNA packaging protein)
MSNESAVSASAVARHLDLSRQRVDQLAQQGVFQRDRDGRYDLDRCRIAYIHRLRDNAEGATSEQQVRLQEARAAQIELRNLRESGELVDAAAVEEELHDILGTLRTDLSGVPAGATRDLQLRKVIEQLINDAIDSARAKIEQMGAERE